jgi:hypothetical protein
MINLTFRLDHSLTTITPVVPAYANNAAALTGGLVPENTYYNTSSSNYTRVI